MANSIIAEIHITPIGTESASVSRYIAPCVKLLKQNPDLKYQISAMGTVVEGPMGRVLEVARQMHEIPFTMGAKRVLTNIIFDDRRDKAITIESKVKAVS